MSRSTVKSFHGSYTLVIYNPPQPYTPHPFPPMPPFTQKIDLTLTFNNGVIDAESNVQLLRMIAIIEDDLKREKNLIATHWYDNKGKVEYTESDAHGRVINNHTYSATNVSEIQAIANYMKSMLPKVHLGESPKAFTPLLKAQNKVHPEEQEPREEMQVVSRARKLLGCCFGY